MTDISPFFQTFYVKWVYQQPQQEEDSALHCKARNINQTQSIQSTGSSIQILRVIIFLPKIVDLCRIGTKSLFDQSPLIVKD